MSIRKSLACAVLALSLTACQTGGGGYGQQSSGGFGNMSGSETVGTLGGAAAGALLGSRFGGGAGKVATVGIGTVLGALAGREIARRVSGTDERQAVAAEQRAVASNEPISWNNPETGNRGTIQPQRTYRNDTGQTCREYTHTIYVDGRAEAARGTACRQPDGTWQLVS